MLMESTTSATVSWEASCVFLALEAGSTWTSDDQISWRHASADIHVWKPTSDMFPGFPNFHVLTRTRPFTASVSLDGGETLPPSLQASKTCTQPDQSTTQLVPGAENDFHAQLAACRFASASRPAPKMPDGEKGALRLGSPPSKCNPSKPRNPGASRWSSLVDGDG